MCNIKFMNIMIVIFIMEDILHFIICKWGK